MKTFEELGVSEETGHISVAQGGRLQLDLTAEEVGSRVGETVPRALVNGETTEAAAEKKKWSLNDGKQDCSSCCFYTFNCVKTKHLNPRHKFARLLAF